MTKLLKVLTASTLVLGLAACSSNNDSKPETKPCPVKIGLVTDTGGVDDKSFNQSAWEGLVKYAEENEFSTEKGECIDYLQSTSDSDYVPNLSTFADEGYDLIIAVGYLFEKAINEVSANYPDSKFLFIDSVSTSSNVMNAVFAAEDGSFLAGVAAGLKAKENGSNTVGFMGGMEGELIGAFQAGFEQGVLAVNPDAKIIVDYADSFSDDSKGQVIAAKQYDAGATVIYQAAGNAGNGVIKEAKERGDVWVVGVDRDQYEDGKKDDGSSVILTSMLKRVDTATYSAAQSVLAGTFEAKTVVFDLASDGVGAEISEGRNLSADIINAVKDYAEKIKNGEIEVNPVPTIPNGKTNK